MNQSQDHSQLRDNCSPRLSERMGLRFSEVRNRASHVPGRRGIRGKISHWTARGYTRVPNEILMRLISGECSKTKFKSCYLRFG